MADNHPPPWWIHLLLGFAMIFMGLLIVCLLIGVFPTSCGAESAPSWILASIAGGLILGGILLVIPQKSLGPVSIWGEDQIGGRIAFGLAADS